MTRGKSKLRANFPNNQGNLEMFYNKDLNICVQVSLKFNPKQYISRKNVLNSILSEKVTHIFHFKTWSFLCDEIKIPN